MKGEKKYSTQKKSLQPGSAVRVYVCDGTYDIASCALSFRASIFLAKN